MNGWLNPPPYIRETQRQITYRSVCRWGFAISLLITVGLWALLWVAVNQPSSDFWICVTLVFAGLAFAGISVVLWDESHRANDTVNHLVRLSARESFNAMKE